MTNAPDLRTDAEADESLVSADLRGAGWKFAVLGALTAPNAPRVFTAHEFASFVAAYRPGTAASTARVVSDMLVSAGALRRVSSGLFLNRRATPPAELVEVAPLIRAGAVISLHSVLGECGFLNNPPSIVTAVIPTTTSSKRPRLGDVTTSSGFHFRFYGLASKFFPTTESERREMLQPGRPAEMFRPEAALLHWLYLSHSTRSSLTAPPLDVDMDTLDQELLGKLAGTWGLTRLLSDWHAKAVSVDFGADPEGPSLGVSPEAQQAASKPAPPSQEALDESAAARARLLARRPAPR